MREKRPVIYMIYHKDSLKAYVGKTVDFYTRIGAHKSALQRKERCAKTSNPYLYAAVQKYGWDAFAVEILEEFDSIDENLIKERELHWMVFHKTTEPEYGYNLRMDSSSKMITHPSTIEKLKVAMKGSSNPNYGNKWSSEQRKNMSEIAQWRYVIGVASTEDSRAAISKASKRTWSDLEKRKNMGRGVSLAKRKYNFFQYTRQGELVGIYDSIEDIVLRNPGFKWQNIYSVCSGHKPTYMNHVWKKIQKETSI
jgi:group I intron endonuclease